MSSQPFHKSLFLFVLFLFTGGLVLTMPPKSAGQSPSAAANSSSLLFIENVGQFDEAVRFRLDGNGGTFWLTEDGLWLSVLEPGARPPTAEPSAWQRPGQRRLDGDRQGVHLKLTFVGANPRPHLEAFEQRPARFSYFIGNDPAGWHRGVATWGGVRYVELYPGIDLELVGENGRFAPRVVCRADCQEGLQQVALRIEGADRIEVVDGQLWVGTAVGEVHLPLLQVVGESIVDVSPRVQGNRVVMPFGEAMQRVEIPEDEPADLLYSTFLGGSMADYASDITIDDSGAAYVTGQSLSTDFPTTVGSFVTTGGGSDSFSFVAKLNSSGSDLIYAAFLGGNGHDGAWSIALDNSEAVYIVGVTDSTNFPTTFNAYDRTYNGGSDDSFVAKIEANGTILTYSTYLGGNGGDESWAIAVDQSGQAYTTGLTGSPNFPTTANALPYGGGEDAYVTKINSSGSDLIFSTFLGGWGFDWPFSLALDSSAAAYVTGFSSSVEFTVPATGFDQVGDALGDGFIGKFDSSGALSYFTFFGGSTVDGGHAIVVDGSGNAIVTGATESADFPVTAGSYDPSYNGVPGQRDGFVLKVNQSASSVIFGTFLGGTYYEIPYAIALAADGSVYVSGHVGSSDYPTTANAFDNSLNGEIDTFLSRLSASGSDLLYSTFIGGSLSNDLEENLAVAVEGEDVYLTGYSSSADFPTTAGAFDTVHDGSVDGFVAKLTTGDNSTPTPTATATDMGTPTGTATVGPTATPSATAGTPEITVTATEAAGTTTPTPTWTPLPSASATPTASSTPTPTATVPALTVYQLYLPAIVTSP